MKHFDDLFWRYMLAYKKRTIFTILGISLAVLLFFGAGTIYVSVRHAKYEAIKNKWGDYDASGMVNPEQYKTLQGLDCIDEMVLCHEQYFMFFEIPEGKTESELANEQVSNSVYYMVDFRQQMFQYNLMEGRYPENCHEVIVNRSFADFYDVRIGEVLELQSFEYWDGNRYLGNRQEAYNYLELFRVSDVERHTTTEKEKKFEDLDARIVTQEYLVTGYYDAGIYEDINNVNGYPILSQIDGDVPYHELTVYVRFQNHKNYLDQIAEAGVLLDSNDMVQSHVGDFAGTDLEYILIMFAFIILFWIDVIIIRNAFVMSVAERTRDYGILRCMGTSQRKMRRLLMKEGLIEVIAGCTLGIGLTIIALECGKSFYGIRQLLYSLGIYETFHVKFNIWIIIGTIVFVSGAVFFSLIEPSRQIGLMEPMEAVNGNVVIRKEKFKQRKATWIKKLFGIEGEYAYKNLLRNKGKFITSTVGIAFSVVGVIISFSIINITKTILDSSGDLNKYVGSATYWNGYNKTNEDVERYVDELIALESIEDAIPIFGDYYASYWKEENADEISLQSQSTVFVNGLSEEELAELTPVLLEGSLQLEDLEQGGVIVCRNYQTMGIIGGETVLAKRPIDIMGQVEIGDLMVIPATNLDGVNADGEKYRNADELQADLEDVGYITCPVVAIIDYNPRIHGTMQDVFMIKDYYQEMVCSSDSEAAGLKEILIKYSKKYDNAEIYEFCKKNKNYAIDDGGTMELIAALEGYRQLILLTAAVIAGIGAVNIFNTLSSNIALRHQEFKIMSAVGMSRKQMIKMLTLEGGLSAIIGSAIGILLGIIVGILVTLFSMELKANDLYYPIQYQLPLMGIIVSVLLAVGITMVSTLIAYHDLKIWEDDA